MSWSVKHVYSGTTTDITSYIRLSDLSLSMSASPESQGSSFALLQPFDAKIGAEIQVRDSDNDVQYRGWVISIEREDHGPVAGLHPKTVLVTEDIYSALKRTTFPVFSEGEAGEALNELPSGLRKADRKYQAEALLDGFDMSVDDVFAWALARIETLESAKGSGRVPRISTSTANVSTAAIDASTGSPFRFGRYFPQIIDGLSYWDVLNGIAAMAGMNWYLKVIPGVTSPSSAGVELYTWDATEDGYGVSDPSNFAGYEVVDDQSATVGGGQTAVLARNISMREDSGEVINTVELTYEPKDGNGVSTPTNVTAGGYLPAGLAWDGNKISNTSSVATYGQRYERMVTDFVTREMAIATGARRALSAGSANIRGSARVLNNYAVIPGQWVMVHRTDHPESGGYYKRRGFLHTVSLIFEDGQPEPIWMELSFNHDVYQAPNFRPFVSSIKPKEIPPLVIPPLVLPPPAVPPVIPPITVTPGVPPVATPGTPPVYRSSSYAVLLGSIDSRANHTSTYRAQPVLAGSTRANHKSRLYTSGLPLNDTSGQIFTQAIPSGSTVSGHFSTEPNFTSVGTGSIVSYFTLTKPTGAYETRGATAYFFIRPSDGQGYPSSLFGTVQAPATELIVRVAEGNIPTASAAASWGFLTGSRDDCKSGTYYTYQLSGKGGHRIAVPIPEPRNQANPIHLVFAVSAGLPSAFSFGSVVPPENDGDTLIRQPHRLVIGLGTDFFTSRRLEDLPGSITTPIVWNKSTPTTQLGWDPSNAPSNNTYCWVLWETKTNSAGVVQSDGVVRYQQYYDSGQFAFKLADPGLVIGNTLSVTIGTITHHISGGLRGIYGDNTTTDADLQRTYPGTVYATLRAAILSAPNLDKLVGFNVRNVYPSGIKKVVYPKQGLIGPTVSVAYKKR